MAAWHISWVTRATEPDFHRFIASHAGSVLQTAAWGRFKALYGWRPHGLLLQENGTARAGLLLLEQRDAQGIPFVYSPRGPVVPWARDRELLLRVGDFLTDWARQRGVAYWLLDPEVAASQLGNFMEAAGFRRSGEGRFGGIQPRWVWRVPLFADEARQWQQLTRGARRQVQKAKRQGLEVTWGQSELVAPLAQLIQCTAQHPGVNLRDSAYFARLVQVMAPHGYVRVALARLAGKPVAAALIGQLGEVAWDLYAGCDRQAAAGASYALLYSCLRRYAREGYATYDLGGIEPEAAGGLGFFKSRFGGGPVQWVGEFRWDFGRRG